MRGFLFLLVLSGCGSAVSIPDDTVDGSVTDSTSSSSDAPRADTPIATEGGKPLNCSDPTTYPTWVKGCTTSDNCSFGLHQIDCCGSQAAIGFNHAERERFDLTEKTWRSICPVCDCREKPTTAEDGKTGTSFGVRCVEGKCQTYVK